MANMKQDDIRMSVSPPMPMPDPSQFYARLFSQNQLSAQIMANNALFARLPVHMQLAAAAAANGTPFYPHPHHQPHPAMFGNWPQTETRVSPPISPVTPHLPGHKANHLNNLNNNNNNNLVSTTTNHLPTSAKKPRKSKQTNAALKKDLMTPPLPTSLPFDIHLPHPEMTSPTGGPISPPTSGASPQSTGSMDHSASSAASLLLAKDAGSRDKQFTCKICSRSFGYKHVLQNHERTHTGEKPFECPECKKRFTRDHHLKTHMRLHTGEKPYHCDHCDRHFVQVANLRRHMRVHTGEKPYKCEICKSTFADSNQLKGHKAIHNDDKPYHCDRCNDNFKRRHHKCAAGIMSPPTPAMSPALSPVTSMSDHKSGSSDISDLSVDLGRSAMHQQHQLSQHFGVAGLTSPDLYTEVSPPQPTERHSTSSGSGHRMSPDIRRVPRHALVSAAGGSDAAATLCVEPEQTEPEDLSMHSPRSNLSADEDLDDLDDAASLYAKHKDHYRRIQLQAAAAAASAAKGMSSA